MNSKVKLLLLAEPVKGFGLVILSFLTIAVGLGIVLTLAMPLF